MKIASCFLRVNIYVSKELEVVTLTQLRKDNLYNSGISVNIETHILSLYI